MSEVKPSEFVFLKNRTGKTQFCMFKGQRITIGERAEEAFPPDIAKAMIDQTRGQVVELPKELGARSDFVKPETTYLANWTGNPDATPTRQVIRYDKVKKIRAYVDEVNPFWKPETLYRTVGGSQSVVLSQAGTEMSFNHPARNIEFPPYQFKELPRLIADQILTQEAIGLEGRSGGLIREVPPPSNFQPDMSWDLEDMRAYLKYMDPDAKLGHALVDLEGICGGDKTKFTIAVLKAKREVLQRLFFRCFSRDFRRPTKQEFDEFVGRIPSQQIQEEEAAALLLQANHAVETAANTLLVRERRAGGRPKGSKDSYQRVRTVSAQEETLPSDVDVKAAPVIPALTQTVAAEQAGEKEDQHAA